MATERKPARSRELSEWFGNPKGDFFAGIVSAFAVIPEVVGFNIVAGVDPVLGLYTSAYCSDGFLGLTQSFNLEL